MTLLSSIVSRASRILVRKVGKSAARLGQHNPTVIKEAQHLSQHAATLDIIQRSKARTPTLDVLLNNSRAAGLTAFNGTANSMSSLSHTAKMHLSGTKPRDKLVHSMKNPFVPNKMTRS